jgi:hypothetical protein
VHTTRALLNGVLFDHVLGCFSAVVVRKIQPKNLYFVHSGRIEKFLPKKSTKCIYKSELQIPHITDELKPSHFYLSASS